MNLLPGKKGISPLIASVLLIAFTISVAGLFSSWVPDITQGVQQDTSDDADNLLNSANADLGVDSATFDGDSGNTSVVFRNTGQTDLSNFTVTARLEDGSFVQKDVSESLESAGIVSVELNTSSAPNLVRVDSNGLGVSVESESISGASNDEGDGSTGDGGSVDFQLSGVGDDGPVTEGDTLSVDYTVSNDGGVSGVQDVVLDVSGVQEDVDSSVSLSSGGSSTGSLSWVTESGDAGTGIGYTVSTGNDSVSGSVDVDALSGPSAVASDNVSQPEVGDVVEFDASGSTSGDGSITGYDWDVDGDGNFEKSGETVTHTYSNSGTKNVELNVTDSNDLYNTDSLTVDVQSGTSTAVYDFEEGPEIWENTEFTDTTTRSYSGSASLDIVAQSSSDTNNRQVITGELSENFTVGDSLELHTYGDSIDLSFGIAASSFDEVQNQELPPQTAEAFQFSYQSQYDSNKVYYADGEGSISKFESQTVGVYSNEWITSSVNYTDETNIDVSMVDSSGTEFFTTSFNPNDYTSRDSWSHLSLGAKNYNSGAGYADDIEIKYN